MTKGLVYVADDEKDIRELIKSFFGRSRTYCEDF